MNDPMNPKIPRDARGPIEAEDPVRDALDRMRQLASETRSEADRFSSDLSAKIAEAMKLGEALRAAHFDASDRQEAALRDIEKGAEAAERFAASTSRGQTKIDRTAVVTDAARRTGAEVVMAAGPDVLGNVGQPSLADRAAEAGRALEQAIARASTKWRSGLGRPEALDDLVAGERMRATLRSKSAEDLYSFTIALLSDSELDDRTWSTIDSVARDLAVAALEQRPVADRTRTRSDKATTARLYAQRTIEALDAAVEARTPRSIALATEALTAYRQIFAVLCAPNALYMTAAEYAAFRSRGEAGLADVLGSWRVDPRWLHRFLQPRPWRCPGWAPVRFIDRTTGKPVRG